MWVDSHCHLQLAGGDEHVVRARAAGVEWMVCVGTDLETSAEAAALADRHPDVYAAVGLHPHDASKLGAEWPMLEPLAVSDACIAIGECGFDLFYEHSPRDEQETAFRFQIRLAKHTGKPLVIHSRDAWDDTFRVLDDEGVPERTIFHCFTGGPVEARLALDRGCFLSFSGIVSFKNADDLREAARGSPRGSRPRRDRFPVPHARAVPRAAERTCTRGRGRGCARPGARRRARRHCRDHAREREPRVRRRTVTPSEITELLTRHGVRPSKALGQNFLADENTARRIVRLAELQPGDRVVEVGPGIGSLTVALADTGAHVCAVELDRHLVPILEEVVAGRDVEVINDDALRVDWGALLDPAYTWSMVANLPYNVATSVVIRALETAPMIKGFLVMVQREVGERIAAGVGDDAFGAVSVKVAYYATGEGPGHRFAQRLHSQAQGRERARAPCSARRATGRRWPTSIACSSSCAPVSRRGARRCGTRWTGVSTRPSSRARTSIRRRGPKRSRWPTGRGSPMPEIVVTVAAKLTLSLHITGTRADGYHELDATMVSIRGSERPSRRESRSAHIDHCHGSVRGGCSDRRDEPRVACGRSVR